MRRVTCSLGLAADAPIVGPDGRPAAELPSCRGWGLRVRPVHLVGGGTRLLLGARAEPTSRQPHLSSASCASLPRDALTWVGGLRRRPFAAQGHTCCGGPHGRFGSAALSSVSAQRRTAGDGPPRSGLEPARGGSGRRTPTVSSTGGYPTEFHRADRDVEGVHDIRVEELAMLVAPPPRRTSRPAAASRLSTNVAGSPRRSGRSCRRGRTTARVVREDEDGRVEGGRRPTSRSMLVLPGPPLRPELVAPHDLGADVAAEVPREVVVQAASPARGAAIRPAAVARPTR
jgi:hypothetical protein